MWIYVIFSALQLCSNLYLPLLLASFKIDSSSLFLSFPHYNSSTKNGNVKMSAFPISETDMGMKRIGNTRKCVSNNLTIWYVMEMRRIVVEMQRIPVSSLRKCKLCFQEAVEALSLWRRRSKCLHLWCFACFVDATVAIWSDLPISYNF